MVLSATSGGANAGLGGAGLGGAGLGGAGVGVSGVGAVGGMYIWLATIFVQCYSLQIYRYFVNQN